MTRHRHPKNARLGGPNEDISYKRALLREFLSSLRRDFILMVMDLLGSRKFRRRGAYPSGRVVPRACVPYVRPFRGRSPPPANKSATVAPAVKYMEQTIPPSPSSWIRRERALLDCSLRRCRGGDLVGLTENVEVLGTGAFGGQESQWRKTPAAAKVVHKELQEKEKQLLLRELELMMRCRHPNIVQFLGYMDTPFVIVMEFCPMGDLRTYWRSRTVSVSHKCRICVDILRGLAYMHNRKPHAMAP